MSATATTVQDRAASVIPAITCAQGDDVLSVSALPNFALGVEFVDGTRGVVRLDRLIHSEDAGVFARLRDEAEFRQVHVELGTVIWANGLDLAPDAMYAALRSSGEWRL